MTLKKQFLKGFAWTYGHQISTQIISFLTTLFFTRLLEPSEIGIMALLLVYLQIVSLLISGGMGYSLIRMKEIDDEDYSTVFWYNLLIAVFLYILFYLLFAPLIASFYNQPILIPIIRALSIHFIIGSLSIVQRARFTQDMNFKVQVKIAIPSLIIGGIVGIYLANLSYGLWSIVVSWIVTISLEAIQYWLYSNWRPKFIFNKEKFINHFKFGSNILLTGIVDTIFQNSYTLIIGKYFSAIDVGYFTRADSLKQMPVNNIGFALNKVVLPLFSKQQDDLLALKTTYKKLIKFTFFAIAPILFFMIVLAEPIIRFLFTDKWLPAVPYFQILCISGIFQSVQAFNTNILIVKGKSNLYFRLELFKKIILTVIIIISFFWGIYGLLWGSVLFSILSFVLNAFFSGREIDYSVREQIYDMSQSFIIALICAIGVYFLNNLLTFDSDFIRLLITVTFGFIIYFLLSYLLKNSTLDEIKKIFNQSIYRKG